jgi:phage baseplate assembly protein V
MIDQINRLLAPIQRRVMMTVGRCVLAAIKDGAPAQLAQVSMLAGEVRDNVERMSDYGFTSVPLPGAQGVVVFVGGERGHGVVIATGDSRYRLKDLQPGEVVLKRGNTVEVTTHTLVVKASTKVRFETPLVETTGQIKADGNITDTATTNARTMKGMRDVYNTHTHPENGTGGGTTSDPNQDM